MHVLLIHQAFAALDEPGGTRHHELARFLVEKGHRVTVIASPVSYLTGSSRTRRIPWVQREEVDGITILRAYTYTALHRSFAHRVISFASFMISSFLTGLSVSRVNVVWGTSPPLFQGFTAWLLARLKGARFLFEVRDLWPAFAVAVGVLKNPILIALSEWLERFLYQHADEMMVNSPGFIEHISQRGAGQITLIPNGADPSMFDPLANSKEFRKQHSLEGKFVAMYAGAHGMSNDLGVVLSAAQLLENRPDICFVLLGDGKEKSNLVLQAQKLNLQNVRFLPPISKRDIPKALAAADACIAILKPIELYKTTYPNKVFDYMAASRPVVLAIDGVIREVVESVQAGIPVQPGSPESLAQAIVSLADDPQAASAMGERGRRYVDTNFNRARLAEQLELLLLHLVRA